MTEIVDVAVVGAGPAGCGAAVQCRRLGMETALLDRTGMAGGLVREARLLENYPGLESPVSGIEFCRRLEEFLGRNCLRPIHAEVTGIAKENGCFELAFTGGTLKARSVVIATGTVPVQFGLHAEGEVRIHRSVLGLLPHPPGRVAVIGGGESAMDYSLHLAESGSEVALLVRSGRLRGALALKDMVEKCERIDISYNTAVKGAIGSKGVIRLELTGSGDELETDALLAAVGREPFLPSFDPIPVFRAGTVITSVPGLYIAGDASLGNLGQASIAAGQGVRAAMLAVEHYLNGV